MRADRLISILLLLQSRGRMTATDLSRQLEVSERTIYRDLEALSMSGVPIYSEHGPGGGYALIDSYRTTLTGLNEAEVRTLFLSGVYAPLADLGLAEALEVALLKLSAALPEAQQRRAERMRQRIHLDAIPWFQTREAVPHLQNLQEAIWQDQQVRITYRRGDGQEREYTIDPYGLVAKSNIWYVVAGRGEDMRVFRVSRILTLTLTAECFERPPGFELASYWAIWCREFETSLQRWAATLRISPELVPNLPGIWGAWVQPLLEEAPEDEKGWRQITVYYDTFEWAFSNILPLAARIEVIDPPELRQSVIDIAASIVAHYNQPG
ncbi:MAG: YafY family transcriptional regulator [Anaerolineae bacterium]|nr:YafY family transcriptional regulator [Anaerolineae bacterium]